jgi:hypothetical protein
MSSVTLPPWKALIDSEYNKYKAGSQSKTTYLMNVISYFTGAGTLYYPVEGQQVKPSDLTLAERIKYEIYEFDIRKIQMQVHIQSNMVDSTRVPRDWDGVKALIDQTKTDSIFGRSPDFSTYSIEEQTIWNRCQIPMSGSGTTRSDDNHPLYNKICDIYNDPISKGYRTTLNWGKYYEDFCVSGVGPAGGFFSGEYDKQFVGLTPNQLKEFQLPTDDARRLLIAMHRTKYRALILQNRQIPDAATQTSYQDAIRALSDNNTYIYSFPMTTAERDNFLILPTGRPSQVSLRTVKPMEVAMQGGRKNRRKHKHSRKRKMRNNKRSTRGKYSRRRR